MAAALSDTLFRLRGAVQLYAWGARGSASKVRARPLVHTAWAHTATGSGLRRD